MRVITLCLHLEKKLKLIVFLSSFLIQIIFTDNRECLLVQGDDAVYQGPGSPSLVCCGRSHSYYSMFNTLLLVLLFFGFYFPLDCALSILIDDL